MIVGHIGGGESAGYEIPKSLRFRASTSPYLSRTPTVAGNRKTWTWSAWVKRGALSAQILFASGSIVNGAASNRDAIGIGGSGALYVELGYTGTAYSGKLTTTAVFRDPSAWYHVVVAVDTTNATAADRCIIYVNGTRQTVTINAAFILSYQGQVNSTAAHRIGSEMPDGFGGAAWGYLDGYLSEINFIDGQALDPSYFGQVSAETGSWIPKKYTGTYGTNGFYLPFNDGSNLTNLTADRSGNGNNWTATDVSLTAGATYGWMDDTPTNNFAVLNSLKSNLPVPPSEANLYAYGTTSAHQVVSTVAFDIGGAGVYAEVVCAASPQATYGIKPADESITTTSGIRGYYQDGAKYIGTGSWLSYGASFTSGDVIGIKAGNGELEFFKNGVSQGVAFSGLSGLYTFVFYNAGSATSGGYWNFGQRPFAYTPPTGGQKALCTKNLPAPSILNPKKHFDVVLATGANIKSTAEAVFPSNFLEWIKDRGNANNHQLIDTVRGTSAVLQSNTTGAETTYSAPSGSSVGWLWKAGGAPVANNAGSIASQVSANPQAGFSIVTYTGTGANGTVGHGLGVAPKMVIVKTRTASGTGSWLVYHADLPSPANTKHLYLNGPNPVYTNASIWNSTSTTSSVFSVGPQSNDVNDNTANYVAYCFSEIPGYSKIGSYTGNGSADGPFVYCGFRPRYVLIKRTDTTSHWRIIDTARSVYNANGLDLYPNLSNAEGTVAFDFLSNGIKPRVTDPDYNASGSTFIFLAFAESPFKYSTAR